MAEMGPELPKELTFVHAEGAAGKMQERSAFEAEKTHQFHHGKAACFLLIGRLRIGSLILRGVGHRQAGAIDDFDLAGKPATLTGGVGFHALSEMAMDVQKHSIGKPLTGLHLREKRPEGDQGTKEPFSAASAPFVRGEQSSGNHRTESRSLHQYYAPQNEPNGQITTAYIVGVWPPGMDFAFGHYWKAIDASTAMFRDAAHRIKAIKPTAKVMSVEALPWWERAPLDPGGMIYHTMIHGNVDYLDRVYDVCDILGINYYYSQAPGPLSLLAEPHRRGLNFTMMGWRINPEGLYKEIRRVADRYGKPMMITENGIAISDDAKRVWYTENHLAAIGRAVRDGYDVRGYFAWSLADYYEWHYGYQATFGLAHMNPKTYERVLKPSAKKFSQTIKDHTTVRSVTDFKAQIGFR